MLHRCLLPFENAENATYSLALDVLNASYPRVEGSDAFSQCLMFTSNYTGSGPTPETKSCDRYVYDRSVYHSSTMSEVSLEVRSARFRG